MTNATITKTLKKVANETGKYSLGYARYTSLPSRVQYGMKVAHYVETGSTNTHKACVDFLASMSETEFISWMRAN